MFRTYRTSTVASFDEPTKVLLYAHHGFGKTYQCRHYAKRYGKGLILSGEAGLKSVSDVDIEYVPFGSWDGQHDPASNLFSFRGIMRDMHTDEFRKAGFKWIAIDSLTEVTDRLLEHLQGQYTSEKDTFKLWGDYDKLATSALKWIRDLPLHVYVTCLAKEEADDQGMTHFWPSIKGQQLSKKVPALFDHVFCGVRKTDRDAQTGAVRVSRHIVTDEVGGWHGKTRDPKRILKPVEPGDDLTELLVKMSGSDPSTFGKTI